MEKKKERQNIIIPRTKYFTTRYFIFLGGCVGGENRRKTCSILTYIRVVEKFPATIYASLCILPPPLPPPRIFSSLYIIHTTARTFASPRRWITWSRGSNVIDEFIETNRVDEGVSFFTWDIWFGHGSSYNGILVSPLGEDRRGKRDYETNNGSLLSGDN